MQSIDNVLIELFKGYVPVLLKSLVELQKRSKNEYAELGHVIKQLGKEINEQNIITFNEMILLGEAILVDAGVSLPRTKELQKAINDDLLKLSDELITLYKKSLTFRPKIAELQDKIINEYSALNRESSNFVLEQIKNTSLLGAEDKILLIERIFMAFKP